MTTNRTTDAGFKLSELNEAVLRQEEIGFQLCSVEGITYLGTNFNQLIFDDKMPNLGPYSTIVETPPEPILNGKVIVYAGEAYIENTLKTIRIVR
jgi:hypothetical protein